MFDPGREQAREIARSMTAALRASDARPQLALASSNLALFDWNVAAGLVHSSREWSALPGGPAEPVLVPIQKLRMLVHPEDAAAIEAQVRDLLAGKIDSYRVESPKGRFAARGGRIARQGVNPSGKCRAYERPGQALLSCE